MNDQGEQIKKNFLDQWIRLAFVALYVVVFAVLWRLIALLILVVIILQSLHRVIAARNNSTVLTFSEGMGNFFLKVLHYVLYLSDEKPIDFDEFFSKKGNESDSAVKTESASVSPVQPAQTTESAEWAESRKKTSDDDVFADISFTDHSDDNDEDQDKK